MKPLAKYLITFALICGLTTPNWAQSLQPQTIWNNWDIARQILIYDDTTTSTPSYSDTVQVDRWAGSPQRFYLFCKVDSLPGCVSENFVIKQQMALDTVGSPPSKRFGNPPGAFFDAQGTLGSIPGGGLPSGAVGNHCWIVEPYGAVFLRIKFESTDTLHMKAWLWMKH